MFQIYKIPLMIDLGSPGGRPIIKNGNCIGGIGVGGGLPNEDDACCEAGQAIIYILKFIIIFIFKVRPKFF